MSQNLVAIELYRAWHEVPEEFRENLRVRNRWEGETLRLINRKRCGVAFTWTDRGWQ